MGKKKRNATVISAVVLVMLMGNCTYADEILNGSFEADGWLDDITLQPLTGWTDVELPLDQNGADRFGGWVYDDWATDGMLNMTLYTYSDAFFGAGEKGIISQDVDLGGVSHINFDVLLSTSRSTDIWDPNKCTAVLMVDYEVVWESTSDGTNVKGSYPYQVCEVDFGGQHKLSFGIRMNVQGVADVSYFTDWDAFEFTYCGGFGFLREDFNEDCYVNFIDFAMLADDWMASEPRAIYDLHEDGQLDMLDVEVFAESWLDSSYDQ